MLASLLATLSLFSSFATTTVQSYICNPPQKPVITAPADGAHLTAGPVALSGIATASSQVIISIDKQQASQATADQYNIFNEQITLPEGPHTISLSSNSPCGNRQGDDITLTGVAAPVPVKPVPPAPTPPTMPPTAHDHNGTLPAASSGGESTGGQVQALLITLHTPQDKSTTQGGSVYVSGSLSQAATVRISINGAQTAQTYIPTDSFGLSVPLQIGHNAIVIEASSDSGQATATLEITRLHGVGAGSTSSSQPWWRTTPAKIIAVTVVTALVVGLLIWFILLII